MSLDQKAQCHLTIRHNVTWPNVPQHFDSSSSRQQIIPIKPFIEILVPAERGRTWVTCPLMAFEFHWLTTNTVQPTATKRFCDYFAKVSENMREYSVTWEGKMEWYADGGRTTWGFSNLLIYIKELRFDRQSIVGSSVMSRKDGGGGGGRVHFAESLPTHFGDQKFCITAKFDWKLVFTHQT